MNTASRMESTGMRGKIQISQATADCLITAGKTKWITPRQDKVVAKGKGEMQTFWVVFEAPKSQMTDFTETSKGSLSDDVFEVMPILPSQDPHASAKQERLVKWNVEILLNLLRQIEARRSPKPTTAQSARSKLSCQLSFVEDGKTVLDEVQEIISLPKFRGEAVRETDSVRLEESIELELKDYVAAIASMYRDNPFHNFEHASHVTASVVKLLSRIVAPDLSEKERKSNNIAFTLHDHTYGITSDPLTQFACVFSALIHDVDHTGVPNTQLLHENSALAAMYNNRSIAEQNSVDIAWNLLMEDRYAKLRYAIFQDDTEKQRFRQLVVNSVMATDIMDKDSKHLRNSRWKKAFSESSVTMDESPKDATDRKATIVIEHLIQASDVSHTMQHWHVYRKWNERFFAECFKAYREGRATKNPADHWFEGEKGFFDNYIIPLARKLHECGVFGVSSDEYLDYALKNRKEWEARGKQVVAEMVERMEYAFHEDESTEKTISTTFRSGSCSRATNTTRSLSMDTSASCHYPASPVKRAIRLVSMQRAMSIQDLMDLMTMEDNENGDPIAGYRKGGKMDARIEV